MGLTEGGITYRTYYVDGDLPPDFRQYFVERIKHYKFEALTLETEEDQSYGWVPVQSLLRDYFATPDIYIDQYLVLGLRIDRWAIPAALLKAAIKEAETKLREERGRSHLTKLERGEVLDIERNRLMKRSLPSVRMIDFAWNLDRGEVRFGTTANSVNEIFVDLFERTFDLRLVYDNPYISALHCGIDDDLVAQLAEVDPARLVEF